jgi:hypothetical integral membrane protein (TIGR02206 family)
VLATQLASIIYWALPPRLNINESLPFQLCDLAGIIAGLAMLFRPRAFHTLLYFWGLALSTQSFITPILHVDEGPVTLRFWLFWLTHLQIIGSAVYDLVVGGYRPTWRDYLVAFGCTAAYAALATAVNLSLDTNYGYLGSKLPEAGTALDFLPPWPLRPFGLALVAAVWLAVFWLIWPTARMLSRVKPRPA